METAVRRGPRAPAKRLATLRNPRARLKSKTPVEPRPQRPQARCPECQSTDIQDIDGTAVCGECGTTINDSNIVAEVTFGESAAGAAIVQGGFVGEGQRHARTSAPGRFVHEVREPREVSEANGRDEIRRQANRQNLTDNIVDQAVSIYKLALNHNFIQGRQIRTVSAICLYAACRRNQNNQSLLMDFAEGIAVNVFRLGKLWSDMKKSLFLEDLNFIPVIEVENLILKFARKLEFGDALFKVAEDASKILKRMKRDWMVTGRQPAGLCGACLILAARMNNFRRTVREVVYVVKVTGVTVAKRLEEFGRTTSSNLTVDQFRENGLRLKQTHDPPILYERALKESKKRSLDQAAAGASEEEALIISDNETEDASQRSKRQRLSGAGVITNEDTDGPAQPSPRRSKRKRQDDSLEGSDRVTETNSKTTSKRQRKEPRRDADGFAIPDIPVDPSLRSDAGQTATPNSSSSQEGPDTSMLSKRKRGRPRKDGSEMSDDGEGQPVKRASRGTPAPRPTVQLSEEDLMAEEELEREMESILNDPNSIALVEDTAQSDSADAEARAKALAHSLRYPETSTVAAVSDDPEIAEHEFEDDPEVANCLLTEAERKVKERIWVTHNEDWLRAKQAKMLKAVLDEASGVTKKPKKKRKKGRLGDGSVLEGGPPVTSAAEATKRMLAKRAVNPSKHINYANVDRLYAELRGPTPSSSSESATREGSVAASDITSASSVAGAGATEVTPAIEARTKPSDGIASSATAGAEPTAPGDDEVAEDASEAEAGAAYLSDDYDEGDGDDEEEDDEAEDDIRRVSKALGINLGNSDDEGGFDDDGYEF